MRLAAIHAELAVLHARWLDAGEIDFDRLAGVHAGATVAMHEHYVARIPSYRRLAIECGLAGSKDPELIRRDLIAGEEVFKSYGGDTLERRDFRAMTRWLEQIYFSRLALDTAKIDSIERWLAALARKDVTVTYSSGTSGLFSFVPRDRSTQEIAGRFAGARLAYEMRRRGASLERYDTVALTFDGGNQGLAKFARAMGSITRSLELMFPFPVDADVVRAHLKGSTDTRVLDHKDELVARIAAHLEGRAAARARVLLIATPSSLLELCRYLEVGGRSIALHRGSWLMLGGGWKSFDGERVSPDRLYAFARDRLGFEPEQIDEAYSMIECNVTMHRCTHGRFHVPPMIWPMLVDDGLRPIDARGRLAFADPLAISYSGFFASGDEVALAFGGCACGREGFNIEEPIVRSRGRELKGCAGLMAALRA